MKKASKVTKDNDTGVIKICELCPVCGMGVVAWLDMNEGIKLEFTKWLKEDKGRTYITKEDVEFLQALKKFLMKARNE